ncbi:hypothetical protein NDU88_004820 [Pleurodeles waltl]|uniref:Uncharacterized protein n=1 Tax=Pleurodeles waltl TaxID=8319 RepID=A0AAV7SJW4_PLEWA|nr:hypothetical protein NDU88_004820 [Pleurodeles waltl]
MDVSEAECLRAAVALLEKAGRMDLLRREALPALRPAQKAAHGVAAAVMACSPPRSGAKLSQEENGEEYDPRIPVDSKWPTILDWSASESEGEQAEARQEERGGVPPSHSVRRGPPRRVYGGPGSVGPEQASGGGPRFFTARDFVFSGTPDRTGQGECREEEEPGELWAARLPWSEGQAEPRAAGRSPSPGWLAERRMTADAPGKRCGGRGRAPAGAPASWERRPGPAGVHAGVRKKAAVKTALGEGPQRAQEGLGAWHGPMVCG